jgi:hypothetical protein
MATSENTLSPRIITLLERGFPPAEIFALLFSSHINNGSKALTGSGWRWQINVRFSLPKRFFYAILDSTDEKAAAVGHDQGDFPEWNYNTIDPVADVVFYGQAGTCVILLVGDTSDASLFDPFGRLNRLILSLTGKPASAGCAAKPETRASLRNTRIVVIAGDNERSCRPNLQAVLPVWYDCYNRSLRQRFLNIHRKQVCVLSSENVAFALDELERLRELM